MGSCTARRRPCSSASDAAAGRSGSITSAATSATAGSRSDFGDAPLELGELVFARLRNARGVDLEAAPPTPPKRRPVRRRPAKRGELRALAVLARFEALSDPIESIDVRERSARLSPVAQRYLRLLLDEGALSDRAAARRLDCALSALAPALDEVDRVLARE
jgi:hypothetical protein